MPKPAAAAFSASIRSDWPKPGATIARTRVSRCRSVRSMREAIAARSIFTTLSSRTRPPPGARLTWAGAPVAGLVEVVSRETYSREIVLRLSRFHDPTVNDDYDVQ